ncbi:hypothetical protein AGLY_004109 [Aphis glycines]|uniref:Reverse transcriptase zinc-binding domain-containing protein n=1 Tax=Aphis glycines TaxID=307491 RepID=A0A6G0TXM7_APHGL|nr:hypothetical protein AGLY_004109 [Aphis glycines]
MRYLGVELDSRLSFTRHIASAPAKATKSAKAIGRLMPNIGGPSQAKRALLATVVASKLLYASPIWATVGVKTEKNRPAMARAQRTTAIRIIWAYRTISAEASSVISSMIPADLIAHERARIRNRQQEYEPPTLANIRNEERAITIASWQARWDRSTKGRWTHRLIPHVKRWLEKAPMSLNFHTTQMLSGHGCYRSYLWKINRANDGSCLYCGYHEDDVEHTTFQCPRWNAERDRMCPFLNGRLPTADDVPDLLCGPPGIENQDARIREASLRARSEFVGMVENIMKAKEDDKRAREREGDG